MCASLSFFFLIVLITATFSPSAAILRIFQHLSYKQKIPVENSLTLQGVGKQMKGEITIIVFVVLLIIIEKD